MCVRGHQFAVFTDTGVTKISATMSRLPFMHVMHEVSLESDATSVEVLVIESVGIYLRRGSVRFERGFSSS